MMGETPSHIFNLARPPCHTMHMFVMMVCPGAEKGKTKRQRRRTKGWAKKSIPKKRFVGTDYLAQNPAARLR